MWSFPNYSFYSDRKESVPEWWCLAEYMVQQLSRRNLESSSQVNLHVGNRQWAEYFHLLLGMLWHLYSPFVAPSPRPAGDPQVRKLFSVSQGDAQIILPQYPARHGNKVGANNCHSSYWYDGIKRRLMGFICTIDFFFPARFFPLMLPKYFMNTIRTSARALKLNLWLLDVNTTRLWLLRGSWENTVQIIRTSFN